MTTFVNPLMAFLHCKDNHATIIKLSPRRVQDTGLKLGPNNMGNNYRNFCTKVDDKGALTTAGTMGAKESAQDCSISMASRLPLFLPERQSSETSCLFPPELRGCTQLKPKRKAGNIVKLGDKISELVEIVGEGKRSNLMIDPRTATNMEDSSTLTRAATRQWGHCLLCRELGY